jgi:hypothetical protein
MVSHGQIGRWRNASADQQIQYERYSQATTPNDSQAVARPIQVQLVASSLQKLKITRDTTTTPDNSKADAGARKGAVASCQQPAIASSCPDTTPNTTLLMNQYKHPLIDTTQAAQACDGNKTSSYHQDDSNNAYTMPRDIHGPHSRTTASARATCQSHSQPCQ